MISRRMGGGGGGGDMSSELKAWNRGVGWKEEVYRQKAGLV